MQKNSLYCGISFAFRIGDSAYDERLMVFDADLSSTVECEYYSLKKREVEVQHSPFMLHKLV